MASIQRCYRIIYDTAGGPARFYMTRDAITLQIIEDGVASKELATDVAILLRD
jgi:hypothetical protein